LSYAYGAGLDDEDLGNKEELFEKLTQCNIQGKKAGDVLTHYSTNYQLLFIHPLSDIALLVFKGGIDFSK